MNQSSSCRINIKVPENNHIKGNGPYRPLPPWKTMSLSEIITELEHPEIDPKRFKNLCRRGKALIKDISLKELKKIRENSDSQSKYQKQFWHDVLPTSKCYPP